MARVVLCPCCKKPLEWSSGNPFRPFCSQRCKAADLGAWANDEYCVAAQEQPEQAAPFEPVDQLH